MKKRILSPAVLRRRYDEYMNSLAWQRRRKRALKLAGGCCQQCGATAADGRLEVHHLTYERFGHENDADLVVLCRDCHRKADKERAKQSRENGWQALWRKRLNGLATKVYGADWANCHDEDAVAEEFEQWLDRRNP